MNTFNIGLYGSGLFGRNDEAVNRPQFLALQSAGYTTIILWALHVSATGDLSYNDTFIVRNGVFCAQYAYLPRYLNRLKAAGTVKQILFSIGGWGVGDFQNMQNLLTTQAGKQALMQNFNALATALPIDGFDFDMEEWDADYTTAVVDMTKNLHGINNMAITYCPYNNIPFWLNALAQVYTQNNNQQIVSAFNLQCYAGGSGNQPGQWVSQINGYSSPLGITNPAAFVIPGFWCANPGTGCQSQSIQGVLCPSQMQSTFYGFTQPGSDPGINGGFVWNSGDLFSCESTAQCGGPATPAAYALAIANGLSGIQ